MSSYDQCKRSCSGNVCAHNKCHLSENENGGGCHQSPLPADKAIENKLKSPLKTNKDSKVSKQTHIVEELCETGELQYHCTACGKRFRSRTQKYYHLQCNQLNNELYECDICKKSFGRHSQLKYHREAHVSPINECHKCQKTFSNPLALKKHEGLHKVEPKSCPHCDKTFLKKISLEQHIAAQHLHQLQYGCAYCHKKYASKSTLQLHLQSHEEKRFECSFCGKLFQRNSILNLHLKRHYQMSTYKCQVCGKAFGESGALARHRKIHEENTLQYHCILCDKNILRKDNMSRHMSTIHPDEKYEDVVQIIRPSPQKPIEQISEIFEETEIDKSEVVNIDTEKEIKNHDGNNFLTESEPFIKSFMNLNEENLAESQDNFVIIENKLLQRPFQTNEPQQVKETHSEGEQSKNYIYNTSFMTPPPIVKQIEVITALPTNDTETDINFIEVPYNNTQELANNSTKYNQVVQDQSDWLHIYPLQEQVETQINFNPPSILSSEQKYVVCHTNTTQELQQNIVNPPTFLQESRCLLSNDFGNTNNAIQNTSSVIRSIGNVNRQLTPHIVNETITAANISLDYEYKHKKYNRHYNLDLYRKILGCDDEEDDNDYVERNNNCLQSVEQQDHEVLTSYNFQQDNSSEATNTTAVHWRKSFKNIYETSTS